ncbi:hypothetical protein BT63DRAFT_273455 [Microthyrium microscopicum]|uniref:RING-type domain-containing protein n=1 Tax=Microthyrium microscopicum TaxID=703497 RepID=A0A6A6U9P3_9PEZI|nr:hypothetical protein BT63DRAFT_273455 [Microthyrium microscopicum]
MDQSIDYTELLGLELTYNPDGLLKCIGTRDVNGQEVPCPNLAQGTWNPAQIQGYWKRCAEDPIPDEPIPGYEDRYYNIGQFVYTLFCLDDECNETRWFIYKKVTARWQTLGVILRKRGLAAHKPVGADDECPICREDMANEGELTWCSKQCGNNFHKECIDEWHHVSNTKTCPLCKSAWRGIQWFDYLKMSFSWI